MTRYELQTRGDVRPGKTNPITFFMKRGGRVVDIEHGPGIELVKVSLGRARVDLSEGRPAEVLAREPHDLPPGTIVIVTAKNVTKRPMPFECVIAIENEDAGADVAPPAALTFAKVVKVHRGEPAAAKSSPALRLAPAPLDSLSLDESVESVRPTAVSLRPEAKVVPQDTRAAKPATTGALGGGRSAQDEGEFCPISDAARARRASLSRHAGTNALYMMTPGTRRAFIRLLETKGRVLAKSDRVGILDALRRGKSEGTAREGQVGVSLDRGLAARIRDRLLRKQEARIPPEDRAEALAALAARALSAAQEAPNQDVSVAKAPQDKDEAGEGRRLTNEADESPLTETDAEGHPTETDAEGHPTEEREAS